ncbi:low temperature requirement protein A [Deinococcus marmoris]|uniref:low temperature requirement protein A n=2 Tax=Deinococcus marmoris TaxID=249408 RepID=UPI00055722C7|nr:low temperature requirement protein A [Deinococcus marmoris]
MTHGQPDHVDIQRTVDPPASPQDQATPQDQDSSVYQEQKVSWLELFFDLIFVVAFDQLAKRLGQSPDAASLLHFGLLFVAVWWAWAGNATFAARYGNETRTYRWGTLAQLVSLGMISLTIRGDLMDTGSAFALAYGVNRMIQAALYLMVSRRSPGAAAFAGRMALSFGTAAALWLVSAAWPGGSAVQIGLWCVALALDVLTPVFIRNHSRHALPHEGHLPERVGLLQIIALGAIVTEIVGGSRQQALDAGNLIPALAAIITAVALWRMYFDQARALPLLGARVEQRVGRMLAWLYGHMPFTLAVVLLGVGLGHGLSSAGSREAAGDQRLVAVALALALLTLAFLRWNSLRVTRRFFPDRSLPALLVGAGLALGLLSIDLDTLRVHLAVAALTTLLALIIATDPVTQRLGRLEEAVMERLGEGDQPDSVDEALDGPPPAPPAHSAETSG